MKIISLNLAGRTSFGGDFEERMRKIVQTLEAESADVICFQEVTFDNNTNLAEKINAMFAKPFPGIVAKMSEKWTFDKFTESAKQRWSEGLFVHTDDYLTDGLAILTKTAIKKHETVWLKEAPVDQYGRPDNRVRIALNVDLDNGLKLSNVHFATNNNAYTQLEEIIKNNSIDRIIVGDFNIPHERKMIPGQNGTKKEIWGMQDYKSLWSKEYSDSTVFSDYISFPDDNVSYDHLLLPTQYVFVSIRVVSGLSDHSAVIFNIDRK